MRNDIRLYTDFPTHYKTKLLIKLAGVEGVWALIKLWVFAASHCPETGILRMSDQQIEAVCDWNTDGIRLVEQLITCGFLEGDKGEYHIHDWVEMQPFVSSFSERSKRNSENIRKRYAPEKRTNKAKTTTRIPVVNESNTSGSTPTNQPTNQPTIPPIPNQKNKHLDCVFLTDAEYSKLKDRYGDKLDKALELYDSWKTNSKRGKEIKSDYKAMLQPWIAEKLALVVKTLSQFPNL